MEAKELRIGNYVVTESGHIAQISEIFKHPSCERDYAYCFRFSGNFFGCYVEDSKPIPLTEQWLMDLGFLNTGLDSKENKIYKIQAEDRKFELVSVGKTFFYESMPVNHVHRLQNLFFALTGEELELKK